MPWCDDCARYWTYNALPPDGTCPSCGRPVTTAISGPAQRVDLKALAGDKAKVPWHFKLMVVALVVYLTWRAVQLVMLVV
jgi:hypothetical protein